MKSFKKGILLLVIACIFACIIPAQEANKASLPAPYEKEEFPGWINGFRRFEIVSLGSFPLMLFYTRQVYDMYRYIDNGFDRSYTPWPFKPANAASLSSSEQWTNILIAGGLAVVIATIDAIIVWRLSLD